MRAVRRRGALPAAAALTAALGVAGVLPGCAAPAAAIPFSPAASPATRGAVDDSPGMPDSSFGTAGTVVLPDVVDDMPPFTAAPVVPVAVAASRGAGGASLVAVAGGHVLARTAVGGRAGWFGWANWWLRERRVPGQRQAAVGDQPSAGRALTVRMPDGGAVVFSARTWDPEGYMDHSVLAGTAMRADGTPRSPGWTGVSTMSPGAVVWTLERPGRLVLGGAAVLPDGRTRVCVAFTPTTAPLGPTQARLTGWSASGVRTLTGDPVSGARPVRLVGLAGCEGLAADGAGRLLAAGPTASGRAGVVRTSAAGAVDPGWGVDGLVSLPAGVRLVPGRLVATARGTVYVGVSARTGDGRWAAGVAKLTAAGVLDPAFGAGGVALLPDPSGSSRLDALTTAPGGTLLVAATTASAAGARRHVLARVWAATGRLDRGFAARGVAVLPLLPVDAWTTAAGGRATVTLAGNTAAWRAGTWVPRRAALHRRVL